MSSEIEYYKKISREVSSNEDKKAMIVKNPNSVLKKIKDFISELRLAYIDFPVSVSK